MIVFVIVAILILLLIFPFVWLAGMISDVRRTQHQIKKNQAEIRQIINRL